MTRIFHFPHHVTQLCTNGKLSIIYLGSLSVPVNIHSGISSTYHPPPSVTLALIIQGSLGLVRMVSFLSLQVSSPPLWKGIVAFTFLHHVREEKVELSSCFVPNQRI